METLQVILSLACTSLGFLVTAVTFILKFIKNEKAKKLAEQTIKIGNAVLPYIQQAEGFMNYTGAEKKEFVMTKANQFAIEHGMQFDVTLVGEKIEELVQLTKLVNPRKAEEDVLEEPQGKTADVVAAEPQVVVPSGPVGGSGG